MSFPTVAEDTLPSNLARALGGLDDTTARPRHQRIVDWGAASECGHGHDHNEDAWGQRDERTFVLADGMGGRPGGATAATAAVSSLLDTVATTSSTVDWHRVMATANAAVAHAGRRAGHDRVGAAVAVVRAAGGRIHVTHSGDVRVYRLRGTRPELLTVDHTVAHELERAGLDPEHVPGAARRLAALTSFVGGTDSWRQFTVRSLDVRPGDRLVLCSDGAYRHLVATDWGSAADAASSEEMAAVLVRAAVTRDGRDDATVVAITLGDTS